MTTNITRTGAYTKDDQPHHYGIWGTALAAWIMLTDNLNEATTELSRLPDPLHWEYRLYQRTYNPTNGGYNLTTIDNRTTSRIEYMTTLFID